MNTSHEPKSTTVLELKYRSYDMFTIIQEFTEKYCGFRGSLFSIHPLSGCERLRFEATEGELVALLISAQVMDQYRGTPLEQDIRKALAKISKILPDTIEVPLDALTGCLSVLPRFQTTYDSEIVRVL